MAPIFEKVFWRLLAVSLIIPLIAGRAGEAPAAALLLSPQSWQAEILLVFSPEKPAREERIDRLFNETLAGRFRAERIQATVSKEIRSHGGPFYALVMSGSEGRDQFRKALFSATDPTLPFTDGPTRLILQGGLRRGERLHLGLEANLASGYSWELEALEGQASVVNGEGEFISRDPNLGVSHKQIVSLEALEDGEAVIRLLYRRPWHPDRRPDKTLTIRADRLELIADLTDPRPALRKRAPAGVVAAPDFSLPVLSLPAAFDWRNTGILTPVRDQGNCGSCWAFGTVAPFEAHLKWKNGLADGPADLSEEFLLSCNTEGYSCNGGWWAHDYHLDKIAPNQTQPGAVREGDFSYVAAQQSCSRTFGHPHRITSWSYVGNDWSIPPVDSLKNALVTYGPVAVAVCAGPNMQSYRGGVFGTDEKYYCAGGVNHAVVLVGWDDGEGTWIMRNSWGSGWGEGGYMRISREVSNIGYAANYVTYASPFTPSRWYYFPFMVSGPSGPPPSAGLRNGDFESGRDGSWTESSTTGFQLIMTGAGGLPVAPHSGFWTAWLGGAAYEISLLSQRVEIPADALALSYWYWIGSEEYCLPPAPYDTAEVLLGPAAMKTYELCVDTATGGWVQDSLDLTGFRGQTLDLVFKAGTDGSYNSNFFLDDVVITTSAGGRVPVVFRGAP